MTTNGPQETVSRRTQSLRLLLREVNRLLENINTVNPEFAKHIDWCSLLTTIAESLHAVSHFKHETFKVYMTDFFFNCSIKSPQCTDKNSKKVFFSIAIFLSRVLMYQKHQISPPVAYKTARPKTGDWERL